MTKRLMVAFVSALCALSLVLSACGPQQDKQEPASNKTEDTTAKTDDKEAKGSDQKAKKPEEQFVGTWKLACAEYDGLQVVGNLTAMLGEETMVLTIADDGTASMLVADEKTDMTWKLADSDDTIELTIKRQTQGDEDEAKTEELDASELDEREGVTIEATLKDGALTLNMDVEQENGRLIFTADGTYDVVQKIELESADEVKEKDEIVGTWKIKALAEAGATMYGEAATLAEYAGWDSDDLALVIKEDGTGTLMGDDITWEISGKKATLVSDGEEVPVKLAGKGIVLDLSELMGEEECFMYFEK